MSRAIPIVMDAGALSEAARAQGHGHDHGADHAADHAADPGQPLPGPAPAWVRVGDTAISEAEIAREMQHHRADDPRRSRQDAARALVVRELLRLEVERLGLAGVARPEPGETAEEAQVRALLEREAPVPEPDAAACRRYYEANRDRLRTPDRLRVRHILLAAPPADAGARAQASAQGEALIAELRQHPERFTEFAQRHSACPSRDGGGELGWLQRGDTTPEFERQLFMLKPGLAGLTVETRWGHHVVCVDAIERGEPLAFEEAAPRIAAYLETQARQNAIHQYLQILAERHGVAGLEPVQSGPD
jgi:peptidyl-prolyl cis-trans isomerase C